MELQKENMEVITNAKPLLGWAGGKIGIPTSARWGIDVLAYKAIQNEVLSIECKSYLNNPGVWAESFTKGLDSNKYKLFNNTNLRKVVLSRLKNQLVEYGLCQKDVTIKLGLASDKIQSDNDREELEKIFNKSKWVLFTDYCIKGELQVFAN